MSWWVTETWIPAAFVLLSVAIVLGAVALTTGRGVYALVAGGCLALIGVAYLVDRAVVTPSEEVVERTFSLANAYVDSDQDRFFEHVGANAKAVRVAAVAAFAMVDVEDDLRITDVNVTLEDEERARIHFRANATINVTTQGSVGYHPSRWHLDWQREEGDWKLVAVERLHPIDGQSIGMLSSQ